jgi:transposase-like protein
MNHHPGLGKQWVNGLGFVRWLERVRPEQMRRSDGDKYEGREAWASPADIRNLYRAEFEGGIISLEVADRICVKLLLHIDSEMPEELWTGSPKGGRPGRSKAEIEQLRQRAEQLIAQGHPAKQIAEELGVTPRTVYNWSKQQWHEGLRRVEAERVYWERAMKRKCDNCRRTKRVTFAVNVLGKPAYWCTACVVRSRR